MVKKNSLKSRKIAGHNVVDISDAGIRKAVFWKIKRRSTDEPRNIERRSQHQLNKYVILIMIAGKKVSIIIL